MSSSFGDSLSRPVGRTPAVSSLHLGPIHRLNPSPMLPKTSRRPRNYPEITADRRSHAELLNADQRPRQAATLLQPPNPRPVTTSSRKPPSLAANPLKHRQAGHRWSITAQSASVGRARREARNVGAGTARDLEQASPGQRCGLPTAAKPAT